MHPSPEIVPANDALFPRCVYIASPLSTFRSPRFLRMLAKMGDHFSGVEFIIGRDESISGDGRRESWPFMLRQCVAVCVFPDHEGWISRGVWTQMRDAVAHGVWVLIADGNGSIANFDWGLVREVNSQDRRRYARLALHRESARTGGA